MEPWLAFLRAFAQVLDGRSRQDIRNAWSTLSKRTAFYACDVLRPVADKLNFEFDLKEFLNIDHVFRDPCGVPRVFIESENDASRAHEEISKLCAVSCPLKVLLTVLEWDPIEGVWTPECHSQKDGLLRKWGKIALAHHQVCPDSGLLALLVGELCDPKHYRKPTRPEFQNCRFRFYAHRFAPKPEPWPLDGIYQRNLEGSIPDEVGQRLERWPS